MTESRKCSCKPFFPVGLISRSFPCHGYIDVTPAMQTFLTPFAVTQNLSPDTLLCMIFMDKRGEASFTNIGTGTLCLLTMETERE